MRPLRHYRAGVRSAPYNSRSMLRATYERLIERLREECERQYGARLTSMVIYGSVARGTMRYDSDIDVLIVAEALPAGRLARVAEFETIEERLAPDLAAARAQGVHAELSPVFKTPEEVLRGSPLFLDMTLEARVLFDRDGFFARYLEALRERMRALGSERRRFGGGYYWILKPDYKPGDRIEL